MTSLSSLLTRMSGKSTYQHSNYDRLFISKDGIVSVLGSTALTKTSEVLVRLLLIIVFMITTLFLMATESHAQDVYNFYFQKNMGAGGTPTATTIPGATVQPQNQPAAPITNEMKTEMKPVEVATPAVARWELSAMRSMVNSPTVIQYRSSYSNESSKQMASKDGFGLQGAYRINKFFALDAGAYYSTGWTNQRYSDQNSGKSIDGSLGMIITPIHINLFGYELIEIAANLGVMSFDKYTFTESYQANSTQLENVKKVVTPYWGPRVSLNFSSSIAAVVDIKMAAKEDDGIVGSFGLKYRF